MKHALIVQLIHSLYDVNVPQVYSIVCILSKLGANVLPTLKESKVAGGGGTICPLLP